MSGEIEEPFRLNFQGGLLQSGSISFGRFESESLSWERRSVFPHNRYLEEVEKYSKPGSVTEKKAYFEAEFRRKALLKQRSSECQDGGEGSNDLNDFERFGNCHESPCSSGPSKCSTETEIQDHEEGDVACFDESTPISGQDVDTKSHHLECQNYEFHPVIAQDELCETHHSEFVNVGGSTEQNIGLILIHHVAPVDVSSEANDDSSLTCQTPEIQQPEMGDVACFDKSTPNSGHDEDTKSHHLESQNYEFYPVTTQDELGETHQSENENVPGGTKQNIGLTLIHHVVPADVSSEANDDLSLTCQTTEKDHDSISSAPQTAFSPKVMPAAEKKLTRSTLKTQVSVDRSQKKVLIGASKGSMNPRTSESKGLVVKKTERKSPRPASPLIGSGVKTSKAEVIRSEKAVKVKAQFPSSEKSLPGVRPTVNRSKVQTINPSKTHIVQSATGFSFKTDQRAENRKEFYTKIAEKMHAKEFKINQVEAKTQEKQAVEMKQFRKNLNFKAKPLPSFYNESVCGSDQHKVTPISKTPNQPRPSSQALATRHDKNQIKSSVPLNIRPSSSNSSTNRIRFSESIRRNHLPEKKDKEKGKDIKFNKQKAPEPRDRDMVTKHVKGIHTWNSPKVGVVS